MTDWLFGDAPTLLALLDEDLICRHVSRGWREHLGLAPTADQSAMALTELFALNDHLGLPDQLRQLLRDGRPLQNVPVSLKGESEMTEGLLSVWRVQQTSGQPGLAMAATCNQELA